MRTATLIIALVLVLAQASMPVMADEECAAWCGDGQVWDDTKGACVIAVPPKTS